MTDYKKLEVYNYLTHLEHYLTGDLGSFHKICKETELLEEFTPTGAITSSISLNTYILDATSSLSSTTTQTTRYPTDISNIQSNMFIGNKNDFRLTIPITLSLFSTIDCVGNLLSNTNKSIDTDNLSCLNSFLENSTIKLTEDEKILLIKVYRNGLSHVYFPKLSLGVSFHSKNPFDKLFFKDMKGILILNVNRLEFIVVDTFKKIKENINLYSKMESRYQNLISEYKNQNNDLILNFLI